MTIPKGENIGLGWKKGGKIMKNAENIHIAKMEQLEQKTYAEFGNWAWLNWFWQSGSAGMVSGTKVNSN